jgi:hypothetical protein
METLPLVLMRRTWRPFRAHHPGGRFPRLKPWAKPWAKSYSPCGAKDIPQTVLNFVPSGTDNDFGRPSGTGPVVSLTRHFVPGYYQAVPPGQNRGAEVAERERPAVQS